MNLSSPQSVIETAQKQLAMYGRAGATRIIKVPALSVAVPAGLGQQAAAPPLPWKTNGTVIAMYGQERTGTVAKFAQSEIRVQVGGDEDLCSNGTAGDFFPMLAVFGPNLNWFPLTRRVSRGVNWQITYQNQDAGAAMNPTVLFAFISDDDMARMTAGG